MVEKTRAAILAQLTAAEQPFELVPGHVFGRACLRFKNAPANIAHPSPTRDAPFIVYGDERLSLRNLCRCGTRRPRLVNDYDIQRGDRAGYFMRNYPSGF